MAVVLLFLVFISSWAVIRAEDLPLKCLDVPIRYICYSEVSAGVCDMLGFCPSLWSKRLIIPQKHTNSSYNEMLIEHSNYDHP